MADAKAHARAQEVRSGLAARRNLIEWAVVAATALVVFGALASASARGGNVAWSYLVSVAITILTFSIFSLGLSLQFGYTGLLNFGHVAFMAIGAYTYGIVLINWGEPMADALRGGTPAGVLVVLLMALVAGAAVAVPALLALTSIRARRASKGGSGGLGARALLAVGLGIGALVAVAVFVAFHPLEERGALNGAAFVAAFLGVVLAVLAGLLLGLPTVRLREDYLAIVTIGSAEILRNVLVNEPQWTRGTIGILSFPRPVSTWALDLTEHPFFEFVADEYNVRPTDFLYFLVALAILVLVYALLAGLTRSPWGRVLRAIREDEDAASSLGKNVLRYKLQSLMVGSGIAAIAGILYVSYLTNIFPDHFVPLITFFAFIIVVMGGSGNHKGAIAGSILLWGIFEIARNLEFLERFGLRNLAGPPQAIIIGLLLVIVMLFRPQGLVGSKEELRYAK